MKKLLVLILTAVAAFAAVFALTACEAKVDKDGNVTITDGEDNGGSSGGSQGGNETGDSGSGESETPSAHTHAYTKQVATDEYLKQAATCTEKAIYYYSCVCGAKGTETFIYGNLAEHKFDNTHTCAVCGYKDENLYKTEIRSKNLTVSEDTIFGKVANEKTTFSFINDIEVADGAAYTVCTDLACTNVVLSKTVNLNVGDNVCYILVTNGNDIGLYTVTVRRRPIYTVSFDVDGGTAVASQQVEEDDLATEPTTTRTGYDFVEWNYDFTAPILSDTTIKAKWQAIKYKITYDLNGCENAETNPEYYTIEDEVTLVAPISKKKGYSGSWSNDGKITKGSIGGIAFSASYSADVKLSQGGTTVIGLNNKVNNLVILPEYDGVKVTSIGNEAFKYCRFASVRIPDSVTSIGDGAINSERDFRKTQQKTPNNIGNSLQMIA